MFCKKCGNEIEEGVVFCSKCGTPVEAPKIFCPGCGQEIKDSAQFCPKCGTKVKSGINLNTGEIADRIGRASEKGLQAASKFAQSAKDSSEELFNKVRNSDNATIQSVNRAFQDKKIVPVMLGIALMQIILFILWFVKNIYIKAPQFNLSEKVSMYECCELAQILNVITILLLIASILLAVLNGIGKQIKGTHILGIITSIWYLCLLLVELIGGQKLIDESEYSEMFSVELLGSGKLMLFLSVVVLVLNFIRALSLRKAKIKEKNVVRSEQ